MLPQVPVSSNSKQQWFLHFEFPDFGVISFVFLNFECLSFWFLSFWYCGWVSLASVGIPHEILVIIWETQKSPEIKESLNEVPKPITVLSRNTMSAGIHCQWAHGVVVSHPLSIREALGSIPNVAIFIIAACGWHCGTIWPLWACRVQRATCSVQCPVCSARCAV